MELHSAGYNTSYAYNQSMQMTPFDHQQQHFDPFAMSNNIPPPTNVQMALMAQQGQQMTMLQQRHQLMPTPEVPGMEPYNPYATPPQQAGGYFNPFSDPFHFPQPPHGENNRSNNNNNTFI